MKTKDILTLLVRVRRKFGIFYALAHGLLQLLANKEKVAISSDLSVLAGDILHGTDKIKIS